ncbi:MAG TPA: carbohydrate binding domain-containing protein [Candidatus Saccharimonadales bacterium]|nr:carbohydrate binding domain-containing protein [Candidatus Saccharimonadales bacterium]
MRDMQLGARSVIFKLFFFFAGILLFCLLFVIKPAVAATGVNQELNFQGRLLNGQGAVVPDGYYNIEFKIYQDGDGQTAGDTTGSPAGTLKWTEDYLNVNSQAVEVRNGYLSVQLGSICSFSGGSCQGNTNAGIDWNSDTLWLSMNVAGTGAACTPFSACSPDGEMTPMKRLSANAYSLNSQLLGGLSAADFGQLAADQTWSGANTYTGSFQIQDTSNNGLLTTDSAAATVQVGSSTTDSTASLFVLDSYSGASDPATGVDGAMYYNTSYNTFRCYTDGAWSNCSGAQGSFVQLAPSTVQLDSSNNNSIFINKTGSGNLVDLQSGGNDAFIVNNSGDIAFANANHSVSVAAATSGTAGYSLTISSGSAGSGGTAAAGGNVNLTGGNAAGTGSANGGNVVINGGTGIGTGTTGLVILSTPTFSATTNDPNCYTGGALVTTTCTIAQSTVDNSSTVIVGFTQNGQTAYLPAPTNTTPGRIFYITAANGSSDFTLSVNGGGTGNEVSMRQNTSATMVWNGGHWGAAGASSSTDLQAAYDNTLQSAGGAELIVSHTSNTNGLTIRDSQTNPVNGPLLSIQTNTAATLFSVNSNVTEYSSDSGAEIEGGSASTFPASTWSAIGGSTVNRYTTVGDYIATGQASVQVNTTATAGDGVKDTLNTTLSTKQHYNVSFAARLTSGAFTDMYVYFSSDGTTQSVACTTNGEVISSVWTKVNCSFTAPAAGITASNAILIGQTAGVARTFYIDNLSVTIAADYNYATDGGVDDQADFTTNWPSYGGATVSRTTSAGNDASDSAQIVTTGANQGIKNILTVAPLPETFYRVTVYAASDTSGFNDFTVTYTPDNGATTVPCVDYNTQSVSDTTSTFTQITCYMQTDGYTVTSPQVYFTQTDGTGRTFYVDTFSFALATDTTPNIQIGGGQNGGPTTLFTLDSAASAPIASNNQQLLGSMYYDTTLGKIQCYEASGWGSCGSASNTIVTISPEYTNAVMHGTGVGTMTSDICSGTLHINDSVNPPVICASDETYNFYRWTSPQATPQTYSVYVTYQLPETFNGFLAASTSLMGRTDSSNATVQYTIYSDSTSGLSSCGSTVAVSTGSVSSWQIGKATGAADPATCSFAAGDSIVFKIDVVASQDADAYVGNLNFTFTNK